MTVENYTEKFICNKKYITTIYRTTLQRRWGQSYIILLQI